MQIVRLENTSTRKTKVVTNPKFIDNACNKMPQNSKKKALSPFSAIGLLCKTCYINSPIAVFGDRPVFY